MKLSNKKYLKKLMAFWLVFALLLPFFSYPTKAQAAPLPNTGAPSGFELSTFATGLFLPTTATFSPDGRLFIAQKNGVVRIYKNGALLPTPFYTVANVNNYVDRGLLGMALDPNFSSNGYVYLLFTYDNNPSNPAGPKTGRLIRVTANGDTASPATEVVILGTNVGNSVQTSCDDFAVTSDCLPADSLSHAPGSVRFGTDGKLYVSVGDGARYDDVDLKALRALNLDSLAGKILRVNPDGTAPTDNPFYNGNINANRSKVWAYGIRNSFRINIRETDGEVFLGDVGWNTWEEINHASRGSNMGWPCYEGMEQQNGDGQPTHGKYKDLPECQTLYQNPGTNLKYPLHIYPHPPSSSVIGGVFYNGSQYPVSYQGTYFYADYSKNQIYNLKLDSNNNMIPGSHLTFASNVGGPVEIFKGPNGDIYYVAINTGSINKITYSAGNLAPTAIANADKLSGQAALTVNFSSSGSSDPENEALSFSWDFGDGTPIVNQPNPTHIFTENGTYNVVLTVTDTHNNTALANLTIVVGQGAPSLTINSPTNLTSFEDGQVVNFSGTAIDPEDGNLTGDSVSWSAVIHHCPLNDCHNHFLLDQIGNNGTFLFPAHDKPFYIELTFRAVDSSGLVSTKSVSIYPQGEVVTHATLFDGVNDFVEVENSSGLFTQAVSVEAWMKSLSTDNYGGEIVSLGNNWGLRLLPDGNLRYFFYSAGEWKNFETTGLNIKDGVWHHVAATKGEGAVKLYVNGVLRATFVDNSPISYTFGQKLTIGKHGDLDDNFTFNGTIDEVRVWDSVRAESQISQYYNKVLGPTEHLSVYFRMEEATGTTLLDTSGNSYVGSLLNGVLWTVGIPLTEIQSVNSAISFSAGSSATVTQTADLRLEQFTIETWVKLSGYGVYGGEIVSLGNNWGIRVNWDGNIRFFTRTVSGWIDMQTTGVNILDNNWHHIAVSRNSSTSTIYLDGQVVLTSPNSSPIVYNLGSTLVFGKHGDGDINFNLSGSVDEFRFWNFPRTQAQINSQKDIEVSISSSGLLAYLKFNESNGLTSVDSTVGDHDAILSAGTVWVEGAFSNPTPSADTSVILDGLDDQVQISGGGDFNQQVFTLESWFNSTGVGLYGGEILSLGNNYGIRLLPDGNLRFFFHKGGFVWNNFETSGINLRDNAWHHVAVVRTTSSVKIFIDGVLVQTFTNSDTISYTLGSNLILGRHGDADNRFNFQGSIDEVRIWSTARSDSEISADFNNEITIYPSTLIGYWKFNENLGVSSQDFSANSNQAMLQNGTLWSSGFPQNP